MPGSGDDRAEVGERQALTRLEAVVGRLLDDRAQERLRAEKSETRVRELETLLRRFQAGEADPVSMQAQLERLESEKAALRARIQEGRDGVDRLLSRIRFLDDQR